ncbi:hypothetical protein QTP88_026292 [Uroleucon formosanum]
MTLLILLELCLCWMPYLWLYDIAHPELTQVNNLASGSSCRHQSTIPDILTNPYVWYGQCQPHVCVHCNIIVVPGLWVEFSPSPTFYFLKSFKDFKLMGQWLLN